MSNYDNSDEEQGNVSTEEEEEDEEVESSDEKSENENEGDNKRRENQNTNENTSDINNGMAYKDETNLESNVNINGVRSF